MVSVQILKSAEVAFDIIRLYLFTNSFEITIIHGFCHVIHEKHFYGVLLEHFLELNEGKLPIEVLNDQEIVKGLLVLL